jgi:predicted AAA+ superfamily ATPase
MVIRKQYLENLTSFKEKQLIKVITGIRRCGKSTLLDQYIDQLKLHGVKEEQIIHINFEDMAFENLLDYREMYKYVTERLYGGGYTYVLLDEVQKVENFQKAVDSLYIQKNVDVYITGSNSDLLSSELATLLTGRYVEIKMLPLSFKEYCMFYNNMGDKDKLFYEYLENSSFPYTTMLPDKKARSIYLEGVINTIITVDIAKRHPTVDIVVLESILKFLLHNIGNLVSSTTIADTLTSNKRKTSYNTVEKYIEYLKESYLIYEATRYDIKGKQHLKSLSKYYVSDNGIRNFMLANSNSDIGHVLENIIYLELLRKFNRVNVGKVEDKEVDFVAQNSDGIEYFQVSATIMDEDKLKAELAPLTRIKDFYPKYLITLDRYPFGNYNGIKIINAVDFLLQY